MDALDGAVGGVDEAGRGPLAGPVVAAVAVLTRGQLIEGVRDSKLLSARRREQLDERIKVQAIAWGIGVAEVWEIDRINILNATMLAMRRAIAQLTQVPEHLQIDGNRAPDIPGFTGDVETVIQGDRHCPAISAASILAKVHRDALMVELDQTFPGYGFARHKGYSTPQHRDALASKGACDAHRRSFAPVRAVLGLQSSRPVTAV